LFPQLPAHSRFHRCDFGEADRMLSFQPLIVRYAEVPPSARLPPSYALKFYRQRSDKINLNQSLTIESQSVGGLRQLSRGRQKSRLFLTPIFDFQRMEPAACRQNKYVQSQRFFRNWP
jgi:hypothetical protein